MKYLGMILFGLLVFGLCFVVDKASGALLRWAKNRPCVRMPLRYPILAAALLAASIGTAAYAISNRAVLFGVAALVFLGVAVFALYTYSSTRIDYDENTFTYRSGSQSKTFRFGEIDCQRVSINKGGCCLVLVLGLDEAVFYGNMQGFAPFLEQAWQGWCCAKGLDPDTQPWHDPKDYRWFPDDEKEED